MVLYCAAMESRKNQRSTKQPATLPVATFPMRINKYLAVKNYSTRRGADELIEQKRVLINGRVAVLGDKVLETDVVDVRFRSGQTEKKYVYFAYNKPIGIISHSPQHGERDIKNDIQRGARSGGKNGRGGSIPPVLRDTFPVGRLDKDSEGLMILTNDGRITDKLLNPGYIHDKEYVVTVASKLRPNFKEKMEAGVNIEGYKTQPCNVRVDGDFSFTITLTEGKKHQIRRMVVALFNEVRSLKRTRIMNISLGNLAPGQYRPIEGAELETFLRQLGML